MLAAAVLSDPSKETATTGEGSSLDGPCDQCSYTNISKKGLEQHIRMKHWISQVDCSMDSEEETKEELHCIVTNVMYSFILMLT